MVKKRRGLEYSGEVELACGFECEKAKNQCKRG